MDKEGKLPEGSVVAGRTSVDVQVERKTEGTGGNAIDPSSKAAKAAFQKQTFEEVSHTESSETANDSAQTQANANNAHQQLLESTTKEKTTVAKGEQQQQQQQKPKGSLLVKKPPAKKRTFDDNLKALQAYVAQFGDANVPKIYEPDPALGRFVCKVRNRRSQFLSPEQRQQLEHLGFDFETRLQKLDRAWEKSYQDLVAYKAEHGHIQFPTRTSGLARWVAKQREKYKQGVLRQDQIDRLEKNLQFVWKRQKGKLKDDPDKESPQWLANYQKLVDFQKEHGHCYYPYPKPGEDTAMYLWISRQRSDFRLNGRLPGNRKELLDNIGFPWKVDHSYRACLSNQKEWDAMFALLVEFQREFGHAWVPRSYENKELARFVANNVASGRNGTLDSMRGKKLQALGLYWGRDDDEGWNTYYDRLKAHREIERMLGTSRPIEGSDIADWMRRQLYFYNKGMLIDDRKKKLEEIDFFANIPKEAKTGTRKPMKAVARGPNKSSRHKDEEMGEYGNAEESGKLSRSCGKARPITKSKTKSDEDDGGVSQNVDDTGKGHGNESKKSQSFGEKLSTKSLANHSSKDDATDKGSGENAMHSNRWPKRQRTPKIDSSTSFNSRRAAKDDVGTEGSTAEGEVNATKKKASRTFTDLKSEGDKDKAVASQKRAKTAPQTKKKPGRTQSQKKEWLAMEKEGEEAVPNLKKRTRSSKPGKKAVAKRDEGQQVFGDTLSESSNGDNEGPRYTKKARVHRKLLASGSVQGSDMADQIAKASIAKTLLDLQSSEKKHSAGTAAAAVEENDTGAETKNGDPMSMARLPAESEYDKQEHDDNIQKRLPVGTSVRKRSSAGWRIGRIAEHSARKAKIKYEDGEEDEMSEDELDVAATAYEMHLKKKKRRIM